MRLEWASTNSSMPINRSKRSYNSDSDSTDVTSAYDASEGVKTWRESMANVSPLLSPDVSPDISSDIESSLQYMASDIDVSFQQMALPWPRYCKRVYPLTPHFFAGTIFLVYYRVYTEDFAIPSKVPVNPEDPYLARIVAKSVAPPHTVSSLKRHLCKVEGITNHQDSSLFSTPLSQLAMDNSYRPSVLNDSGSWSTPQEPFALVAPLSESDRNTFAAVHAAVDISAESSEGRYCK